MATFVWFSLFLLFSFGAGAGEGAGGEVAESFGGPSSSAATVPRDPMPRVAVALRRMSDRLDDAIARRRARGTADAAEALRSRIRKLVTALTLLRRSNRRPCSAAAADWFSRAGLALGAGPWVARPAAELPVAWAPPVQINSSSSADSSQQVETDGAKIPAASGGDVNSATSRGPATVRIFNVLVRPSSVAVALLCIVRRKFASSDRMASAFTDAATALLSDAIRRRPEVAPEADVGPGPEAEAEAALQCLADGLDARCVQAAYDVLGRHRYVDVLQRAAQRALRQAA